MAASTGLRVKPVRRERCVHVRSEISRLRRPSGELTLRRSGADARCDDPQSWLRGGGQGLQEETSSGIEGAQRVREVAPEDKYGL
jgi:hypothetical protein